MKKILILTVVTVLFSVSLYALTGAAYITPEKIARGSYSETIEIIYNPGSATYWYNGAMEIVIPEEFPDLPSLNPRVRGEIKIYYLRSGSTIQPIPNSNIFIDGRAITITAINLSANDLLKIVYGTKDNGGGGVEAPYMPGIYYFLMREKQSESSTFTLLDEQPFVKVTMVDLIKSASVSSIMAKNTITFTLTYKNISNMYQVNEVHVWDTIPQGLSILNTSIIPSTQAGNYLFWNIGSLFNNTTGSIQVVAEAQAGIINYGTRLTNTAKIYASDGYGSYVEDSSISINVYGAKLVTSIYATPATVLLDENFTVLMSVQNQGNYQAYNVSPVALAINGNGTAVRVSGPTPSSISMLSQGATTTFTWIYRATGSGMVYFSGKAIGQENALTIESNAANSNTINLLMPTNTATRVSTSTNTPQHTKTFTETPTDVITSTPTPTYTKQEQITLTPTNTQGDAVTPTFTNTKTEAITPTFTQTSKPVIDTPTHAVTVIPSATPDALVYIDRNHFNPDRNEMIKVHYKVLEQGVVDVKIYNLTGEIIISYSKNYPYVTYDYFYWDGKNSAGKIVGKGIYFIIVKQKSQVVMKKLVVLK